MLPGWRQECERAGGGSLADSYVRTRHGESILCLPVEFINLKVPIIDQSAIHTDEW
jgi:hypothetical protein